MSEEALAGDGENYPETVLMEAPLKNHSRQARRSRRTRAGMSVLGLSVWVSPQLQASSLVALVMFLC